MKGLGFPFCCSTLAATITLEKYRKRGKAVMYHPEIRMFSLPVINEKDTFSPIKYCPYCGKAFPADLSYEWYKTINEIFGEDFLESMYCENRKNLPSEFLTDQWWKKREASGIFRIRKNDAEIEKQLDLAGTIGKPGTGNFVKGYIKKW